MEFVYSLNPSTSRSLACSMCGYYRLQPRFVPSPIPTECQIELANACRLWRWRARSEDLQQAPVVRECPARYERSPTRVHQFRVGTVLACSSLLDNATAWGRITFLSCWHLPTVSGSGGSPLGDCCSTLKGICSPRPRAARLSYRGTPDTFPP